MSFDDSTARGKYLAGVVSLAIISALAYPAGAQELPRPRDPPLRMNEPAKSGVKRPDTTRNELKRPAERKARKIKPATEATDATNASETEVREKKRGGR